MNIHIFDDQDLVALSHPDVSAIVTTVLSLESRSCDEVSIHFVTKSRISELHDQFFGDPTPTDCITLPIDSEPEGGVCVLGEVFICPEVAVEYAAEHGGDTYDETMLYIVHGMLHLLGYVDIDEEDQALMRQAEARHMAELRHRGITLNRG